METRKTQTLTFRPTATQSTAGNGDDEVSQRRLDVLLKLNREIAIERSRYRSDREKLEAEMMRNPLDAEKTFARYGLMLGAFPPASIFARWMMSVDFRNGGEMWVMWLLGVVVLLSSIAGYFSGKVVGKAVRKVENHSWSAMVLATPFIGILWGMAAGGAGGIIIFGIGAIFGAILGAAVGAVALPVFALLHRLVKRGDLIEQKHFLPLAFGVTLTICSFILGL